MRRGGLRGRRGKRKRRELRLNKRRGGLRERQGGRLRGSGRRRRREICGIVIGRDIGAETAIGIVSVSVIETEAGTVTTDTADDTKAHQVAETQRETQGKHLPDRSCRRKRLKGLSKKLSMIF